MTVYDILAWLGALSFKPLVGVMLLPPVPMLFLTLAGAVLLGRRRMRSGWLLVLVGLAGIWLSQCLAVGKTLERTMLSPPPALSPLDLAALKQTAHAGRRVVLVLGGGRESMLPEYGQSHLGARSMQRLHYALFLARQIGAPVMFSGGTGFGQQGEDGEADTAARIAERDYGVRLRWLESESRDTRENARYSLALLAREGGIDEIVLVSNSWHLPRALRAFREASGHWDKPPRLIAAPVTEGDDMTPVLRWMPSPEGARLVHSVLRERIGLAFGA